MRLPEGFVVISEAAPATPFERRVHSVVKRIPAGVVDLPHVITTRPQTHAF